jgi:hypothetical protein
VDIESGRRKQIRLELDREIFKKISVVGDGFEGCRLVDISHYGMGVLFEDGVSGFLEGEVVQCQLKFDDTEVNIEAKIQHSGPRFAGIHFDKIKTCQDELYSYIDSRIVKKFQVGDKSKLPIVPTKIDLKITVLLLVLEAVLFAAGLFIYDAYCGKKKEAPSYLQGHQIERNVLNLNG